jgi:hypothetical protein
MLNLIKQEPVAFQAVIQALIALGTSFGLNLSAGQVGAIVTCTAAILAFFTRQAVTPASNPKSAPVTQPVTGTP